MRPAAVAVVLVLAGTVLTGCEKRAGLLAAQSSAARPAAAPSVSAEARPVPQWRLTDVAYTSVSSVLWDVAAVDATHAWAVGHEAYDPDNPGTTGVPMVQRWDGSRWARTDLPGITWHGGLRLVAAGSPTDVWAVGGSTGPDPNRTVTRVLRHDGTTWAEVPFPPGNTPSGVHITGLAVAGGHTWLTGYRGSTVLVFDWDGSTWRQHTPPAECTQGGTSFGGMPTFCAFTGIVAFTPDDVWVAGNAAWPGFKGPLLFHWDGMRWTPVEVGADNATTAFSEIAGTPTDLWAVGHSSGYGGPVAAHGDGRIWRLVNGLPPAALTGLAVDAAGQPWALANSPEPNAILVTHLDGRWTGVAAPRPPDVAGISLHGITAVPGTTSMLAVGNVDLPGTPRTLRAVSLEYRG